MNNKKSPARFLQGKGFYAALALIIGGAAIASFLAVSEMIQSFATPDAVNSQAGQEDIAWNSPTEQTEKRQDNVPVSSAPVSPSQSTASSAAPSQAVSPQSDAPADTPASQTPSYTLPLADTAVLQMYSGNELVYSETMGDWRTHNGVDLTGKESQAVVAPIAGKIAKAYADDMWGGVVEMQQGEFTVRLCGLATPLTVKEGDEMKTGQVLGKLGAINAESALAPHLHVEIEKDGEIVDPAVLLQYR